MQRLFFVVVSAFFLLLTLPGCVKWYCCGVPYYDYVCVKGTDTVNLFIKTPASEIQTAVTDSLNLYRGMGYMCDTNVFGEPWQVTETCTSGGENLRRALAGGQACDVETYSGCANGGSIDMCGQ